MQKGRFFTYLVNIAALAAGGSLLAPATAIAQGAEDEQEDQVIEEIIEVESPIQRERAGPTGMTIEVIGLSRQVSFADLDLTKHADVTELEKRVEKVAQESCEKLEEMYPLPRNPSRSADIRRCVKKAIASSADEVHAAISAAQ